MTSPKSITEALRQKIRDVRGLGDAIAVVTDALTIKKCSSCEERRKKLNQMFPFGESERQSK
jgi:hypothetical protein